VCRGENVLQGFSRNPTLGRFDRDASINGHDTGVYDLCVRRTLRTNRGTNPISSDQHVTLHGAAIVEVGNDSIVMLLASNQLFAVLDRVIQPRQQNLAQCRPVHIEMHRLEGRLLKRGGQREL
jgi:hypothetical protein